MSTVANRARIASRPWDDVLPGDRILVSYGTVEVASVEFLHALRVRVHLTKGEAIQFHRSNWACVVLPSLTSSRPTPLCFAGPIGLAAYLAERRNDYARQGWVARDCSIGTFERQVRMASDVGAIDYTFQHDGRIARETFGHPTKLQEFVDTDAEPMLTLHNESVRVPNAVHPIPAGFRPGYAGERDSSTVEG